MDELELSCNSPCTANLCSSSFNPSFNYSMPPDLRDRRLLLLITSPVIRSKVANYNRSLLAIDLEAITLCIRYILVVSKYSGALDRRSEVSFMPPLPYMPTPSSQRTKEKVMRVPKQESQTEEEPLGTREEVPSSSNDGGGGDTTQPVEHTAPLSQQRNRYEEQKRRDWNTFLRFLENRQPRLTLSRVRSPHVIEFLKSIDQFGKTLVHEPGCPYFGQPNPAAPCACPLRQSWGSLDALVGRLRAACEESPNRPETNPFGVRAVRNYLLQVKDSQATARGIPYSRKRKRNLPASSDTIPSQAPSDGESGDGEESAAAANTSVISSTCGEEPSTTSTIIPPSASPSLMGEESGDIPGGISSIS